MDLTTNTTTTFVPGTTHLIITSNMAPGWCFNTQILQYQRIPGQWQPQMMTSHPQQLLGLQQHQVGFSAGPAQTGLYSSPIASGGRPMSYQQPQGLRQPQFPYAGLDQQVLYSPTGSFQYGLSFSASPLQPGLYSSIPPVTPSGRAVSHQQPRGLQQPQPPNARPAQHGLYPPTRTVEQNFGQAFNMSGADRVPTVNLRMLSLPAKEDFNVPTGSQTAPTPTLPSAPKEVVDLTQDDPAPAVVAPFSPSQPRKQGVPCPYLSERLRYLAIQEPLMNDSALSLLVRSFVFADKECLKKHCNAFWPSNEAALADVREMSRYFINAQKMLWCAAFWAGAESEEDMKKTEEEKKNLAAGLPTEKAAEVKRMREESERSVAHLSGPKRKAKLAALRERDEAESRRKRAMEEAKEKKQKKREEAAAALERKRKRAAAPTRAKKQAKANSASSPCAMAGGSIDEEEFLAGWDTAEESAPAPAPEPADKNDEEDDHLLMAFESEEMSSDDEDFFSPSDFDLTMVDPDQQDNFSHNVYAPLVLPPTKKANNSSSSSHANSVAAGAPSPLPLTSQITEEQPSSPVSEEDDLFRDIQELLEASSPHPITSQTSEEQPTLRQPSPSPAPSSPISEEDDLFDDDQETLYTPSPSVAASIQEEPAPKQDNTVDTDMDMETGANLDALFQDNSPNTTDSESDDDNKNEQISLLRTQISHLDAKISDLAAARDRRDNRIWRKRMQDIMGPLEADKADKERELWGLLGVCG